MSKEIRKKKDGKRLELRRLKGNPSPACARCWGRRKTTTMEKRGKGLDRKGGP